eukprot:15334614-Ditylum_brightwellii.AAC.1
MNELQNAQHLTNGPSVKLPNDDQMRATINGTLDLQPSLTQKVSTTHVLPNITNSYLLSRGQLYDDGCMALLHKDFLQVYKNNHVVLAGLHNKLDGLWDVQ